MNKQSIKKNYIMNTILTVSGLIFPMISFPYISRVLGPTGTGPVKFATSVVSYFAIFSQLGVPTYGIRICAKLRDDKEKLSKTVHELLFINIMMSILVYGLLLASLFLVPKFQDKRVLLIIIGSTVFFNSVGMEYLYKALEQYTYITVRSLIFKLIALILMFVLIKNQDDYIIYGVLSVFASSASNVVNFIHSRKYISYRWQGDYCIKKHLKAVTIFLAMTCATTVYLHLDEVMIGFMLSDTDVGYYDAAVKLKTLLVALVTSLGAVLLPRTSYYVEKGEVDKVKNISKKALNFVLIISVPVVVFFITFAREGVLFLSGEKYIPSISAMQFIMPTIIFIGITNIIGMQILVPLGKEKIVLYSEIIGAVVDLIVNILLIPRFRSTGAAIGTLMAEIVVFVVQFSFIAYNDDIIDINKTLHDIKYWKIIIATLISFVACFWVKMINVSGFIDGIMLQNFTLLAISGVIFFGIYYLIMLLFKDELTKELTKDVLSKIWK